MSNPIIIKKNVDPKGILIAFGVIALWFSSLIVLLRLNVDFSSPWTYLGILVQTHLYTGLFITAHDAMHGLVSSRKKTNHAIGWLAAILFSYNFYWKLFPKHHEHHRHVATELDPDYHASGNFFLWYWRFITTYVNWWQFILMAITFNLLKLVVPQENLIVFWMLPAVLSTLQLFYFGTYLPHKGQPENTHHSRTQSKNHVWAFISCYFFGYHYEHHDSPGTPWWRLWRVKERQFEEKKITSSH
ncbi:fatty acid desaturase [Pararhodonellum marinum]|uniref:fatty acid desaturase n=1 Tax=Pararhodonellum marinum TaxID=2755358 RepID=UPI0018909354|nr:fatty acid desaturase [Pararhodonellum marinum]